MLQKLLTGVAISIASYLAGRKIERIIQQRNEISTKLEDYVNADKIKKAADALDDVDLDKLRKEFTE
jgi:hypothetical protein